MCLWQGPWPIPLSLHFRVVRCPLTRLVLFYVVSGFRAAQIGLEILILLPLSQCVQCISMLGPISQYLSQVSSTLEDKISKPILTPARVGWPLLYTLVDWRKAVLESWHYMASPLSSGHDILATPRFYTVL